MIFEWHVNQKPVGFYINFPGRGNPGKTGRLMKAGRLTRGLEWSFMHPRDRAFRLRIARINVVGFAYGWEITSPWLNFEV